KNNRGGDGPTLKPRGKPEALFVATHHAREWVAAQMGIRLLEYLARNYGEDDRVTKLLDEVDVWIVPIANPDGYEYTFTNERLWRKNLRDNNEDGEITNIDGVDPNRNFSNKWGLDEEGASNNPSDATYRGPAPFSEPENAALRDLMRRHDFRTLISFHTYGNLILYPVGWQVKTPSFDDPILVALAGTDDEPAVHDSILDQGYDPGVGADLYITNGAFTDWAYAELGILGYTVELTPGRDTEGTFYGFVAPDDEAFVQSVFDDNIDFALSVAETAVNPRKPSSPTGLMADNLVHEPLKTSWGKRQPVTVLVKRNVRRAPRLIYLVDSDDYRFGSATFKKKVGRYYNDIQGEYYDRYEAFIEGQREGDEVVYYVWRGRSLIGPFRYTVEKAAGADVLVVSAEDYLGTVPEYFDKSGPNFLDYYTGALDAIGVSYETWDVEARGVPPVDAVLSHFDAVIWYTGDDRAPDITVDGEFSVQESEYERSYVAMREYINFHGGKLFATGQAMSWVASVAGFGDLSDDFYQYYLGALIQVDAGGMDVDTGAAFPVAGEPGDPVFDELRFEIAGGDGADNQTRAASFLPTPQFLPAFDQKLAAHYERPGGSPFSPFSGDYYVYSNQQDNSYKRLGGTFMLLGGSPTLTFRASFDIETDWDYAFVEIREVGMDNWTTLPDRNGLTKQDTGDSCPAGWVEQLHPQLASYMDADCNPTGSTGEWHALTGPSGGWKQIEIDLTDYAARTVEMYITYASDWGTQGLGMYVDDIELSGSGVQDFETDLGNWTASSSPPDADLLNNFERINGANFSDTPALRTDYSVYLGFGFEAIATADSRAEVMRRTLSYLGVK
ncbi:MAG: M14 family zinc carboxypeptidase, partial [Gammaproteobacteria bacterium]